jgi:hypothetical protein
MLPMRLLVVFALSARAVSGSRAVSAKFDAMLHACILPPAAIQVIDDPKMRTLFRGVAAAAQDRQVKNAFAIVYQDLGPVRIAGDLIFNQLKAIANEAGQRVADAEEVSADASPSVVNAR